MLRGHRAFVLDTSGFRKMAILVALMIFVAGPVAWSLDHSMDGMSDMPGMDHSHMKMSVVPEDPAVVANRLADQRGSEFNHHLAGFILVLAGLAVLLENPLANRWPGLRYVWPMCFLGAGLFLLIFSDPEVWPIGDQSWWYAYGHNAEAVQHKGFALILLILGGVEFERTRGRLKAMWTGFVFPIVAAVGTILLLFHVHGGDMTGPGAMEKMDRIQKEHGWFAATGFGIAISKGLATLPLRWQPILRRVWPGLLIVLGCLLIMYKE